MTLVPLAVDSARLSGNFARLQCQSHRAQIAAGSQDVGSREGRTYRRRTRTILVRKPLVIFPFPSATKLPAR